MQVQIRSHLSCVSASITEIFFLEELTCEEYLRSTGAPILCCSIFAKTAGYYFYCLVEKTSWGYFVMDEGIATVVKVISSKLL